jgi:hypothetical protein
MEHELETNLTPSSTANQRGLRPEYAEEKRDAEGLAEALCVSLFLCVLGAQPPLVLHASG